MPDADSEWLGIPDPFRPPTHYQLLGVAPAELDPQAIAAAAARRLDALRPHESGPRAGEVARLVREVVEARDVLLDPVTRQRYDALTPDAVAQWWQPEPEAAPPPAPTAPVEGWWQGESPDADRPAPGTAGGTPAATLAPSRTPSVEASAAAGVPPAVPGETPPVAAKPQDWWKGAAGEVDVGPPPAPVVPPPPPIQPPPPPGQPPPPAAPLIRESALVLTAPEPTGSPVRWMVLGLVAVGLACVAVVYGMRVTDDRDPETKQVAENKPKPAPDPVDPPDENPGPVRPPPIKPQPGGAPAKTGDPEPMKPDPPMPKPAEKDPPSDEAVEPVEFRGHNGAVFGVAVSRTGKTIFSISDDQAVLHYSPQEPGKHGVIHKFGSPGLAVAFVGDGKTAVFCDGGAAVVYDIAARKAREPYENPRGGIRSLAAAPDGSFLLTGTTDGYVRRWDMRTNALTEQIDVAEKGTVSAVAIAPDARWAAFGLSDGRVVVTRDLKQGRDMKKWQAHTGAVTAVAISPDGKRLVSTGDDGLANVWEPGGKLVRKLTGHTGSVTAAAWCADGRVVTAGIDKTVRRWAPTGDGKPDWKETVPAKIYSLALDPRDRFAVVGRSDKMVQLLPLPPGP